MKRNIITTADGSKTIQIEDWNEQYHSVHGAVNEANHVFINHGLLFYAELVSASQIISNPEFNLASHPINILEIGFGTGLNAFLTLIEAERLKHKINYVGVEAYPVEKDELEALNYVELISKTHKNEFKKLHDVPWENNQEITPFFTIEKQQKDFGEIEENNRFNIIYFDAFGARVQPELWTEVIFRKMYKALKSNGVLVTYSAKGSVRRAMQTVGFEVERLPGPPNKRHMLRAIKR